MYIITSPAKTLDESTPYNLSIKPTTPEHLAAANKLAAALKQLSPAQIADLMEVSDNLASLNHERFQKWQNQPGEPTARPAFHIYNGDIYRELNPQSYNEKQQQYAQNTVRIITGMYGILRAYDLIQPYRLEMRLDLSKLGFAKLADLWQEKVTNSLSDADFILNLASKEYFNAVDTDKLKPPVVTVHFKQRYPDEKVKTVAILAKKARGMMIEYCVQNLVGDIEGVKRFDFDGYELFEATDKELTFVRDKG